MAISGRGFLFRVAAVVALAVLAPAAAWAETFTIAAFDDMRSNRRFLGTTTTASRTAFVGADWYSSVRGDDWLSAPGAFGGDVTVQFLADEVADARSFDFQGKGVDLLVMTEVDELTGESASVAEAERIAQFVRGGGCLVIMADTLDNWQGDGLGNRVLAALDGGTGRAGRFGQISAPGGDQTSTAGHVFEEPGWTSQVLAGPFALTTPGTDAGDPAAVDLETARLGATRHVAFEPYADSALAWSHVLARRLDGSDEWQNLAAEILGSEIGPGAGNVLIVGDSLFSNEFVFPVESPFVQSRQNWNNARLLMNFVHQQVTAVPEPGIMALMAGVLGLAGLASGRRARLIR